MREPKLCTGAVVFHIHAAEENGQPHCMRLKPILKKIFFTTPSSVQGVLLVLHSGIAPVF